MAKYAVIRTDLMHGTKNGDALVSLRYYADEAVAEVEAEEAKAEEVVEEAAADEVVAEAEAEKAAE